MPLCADMEEANIIVLRLNYKWNKSYSRCCALYVMWWNFMMDLFDFLPQTHTHSYFRALRLMLLSFPVFHQLYNGKPSDMELMIVMNEFQAIFPISLYHFVWTVKKKWFLPVNSQLILYDSITRLFC